MSTPPPPAQQLYEPPREPRRWGRAVVLLLVAAVLGSTAFVFRQELRDGIARLGQDEDRPAEYRPLPADDAVLVTVDVTPRSARLMLDGEPLPSNPVRLPRGRTHRLAAVADGYQPRVEEFTADTTKTLRLRLVRQGR